MMSAAVRSALVLTLLCSAAVARAQTTQSAPMKIGDDQMGHEFRPPAVEYNYDRRVVMVPMHDGIKLFTVIFVPKGAHDAPIMLTRTPYNAAAHVRNHSGPPARTLVDELSLGDEGFVENGYIRVYQDVRGKYGSEGPYLMTPLPVDSGFNDTGADDTTDAWDTIEWLTKNVPETNGRVGMIGSSYEGFTVVMALLHPHPALKVAVPESPMVDGWMGDDWFHYGAFRNPNMDYIADQTEQKGEGHGVPRPAYDDYENFLNAGSPGAFAKDAGFEQLGWWRKMAEHPSYDAFWQAQALDKLMAQHPSNVPTLWEQGLWDQEDMWGANHSFLALKAAGHEANNWLVMGPWFHSQVNREGSALGPFKWDGDTALQFRRDMVLPFFNQYLKGGPPANLARATIYNPAENRWEHFKDWPTACAKGCAHPLTPLYLQAGFGLGFGKPSGEGDSYVSD